MDKLNSFVSSSSNRKQVAKNTLQVCMHFDLPPSRDGSNLGDYKSSGTTSGKPERQRLTKGMPNQSESTPLVVETRW